MMPSLSSVLRVWCDILLLGPSYMKQKHGHIIFKMFHFSIVILIKYLLKSPDHSSLDLLVCFILLTGTTWQAIPKDNNDHFVTI